jgi:hypothetical protein
LLRASNGQIRNMLRLHGCGFLLVAGQKLPEAGSAAPRPASANGRGAGNFWQRTLAFRNSLWTNSHRN